MFWLSLDVLNPYDIDIIKRLLYTSTIFTNNCLSMSAPYTLGIFIDFRKIHIDMT